MATHLDLTRRRILLASTATLASGGLAIPSIIRAEASTDVIVIGAGLAGLRSALMLEEAGYKVQVLEGKDRVGGRLYTLDDVPGHPEAGGNEIGSTYGRILYTMQRYGVSPTQMRARTEGIENHTCLNLNGETIKIKDWPNHHQNPFPKEHRSTLPWQFEFKTISGHSSISRPEEFIDPAHSKFDISLYEFLIAQGFSEESIQLGANTNLGQGNSPHDVSLLMWFNILAFVNQNRTPGKPTPSVSVAGGNQRLPEAMAAALKEPVMLNAGVTAILSENDRASVTLADGRTLDAKRIIITAPFAALRSVTIDAPMHPAQLAAINELDYTRCTQLHYRPTKKFWQADGLPPSMWTDSHVARFLALRNNPNDPDDITSFVVYANDRSAQHLDKLGAKDANKYVLSVLAKLRPSSVDALEFVKFVSWQNDPFAGGAYAAWKPGQISKFGAHYSAPAGRLHFAGAHTSIVTRGMEAAMQSAERVVFEVTQKL